MKFLDDYINDFNLNPNQVQLATELSLIKSGYNVHTGGNPRMAFASLAAFYNLLGTQVYKIQYAINSNLARNLPGALMQDWLIHLALDLVRANSSLFIFTEVRVLFGFYPLWNAGVVTIMSPAEKSDLAIGYIRDEQKIIEKK